MKTVKKLYVFDPENNTIQIPGNIFKNIINASTMVGVSCEPLREMPSVNTYNLDHFIFLDGHNRPFLPYVAPRKFFACYLSRAGWTHYREQIMEVFKNKENHFPFNLIFFEEFEHSMDRFYINYDRKTQGLRPLPNTFLGKLIQKRMGDIPDPHRIVIP